MTSDADVYRFHLVTQVASLQTAENHNSPFLSSHSRKIASDRLGGLLWRCRTQLYDELQGAFAFHSTPGPGPANSRQVRARALLSAWLLETVWLVLTSSRTELSEVSVAGP